MISPSQSLSAPSRTLRRLRRHAIDRNGSPASDDDASEPPIAQRGEPPVPFRGRPPAVASCVSSATIGEAVGRASPHPVNNRSTVQPAAERDEAQPVGAMTLREKRSLPSHVPPWLL